MHKRRNFWCWLGLHRWSAPGYECEDCDYPDTLFDTPEQARIRLEAWRAARSRS